MHTYIDSPGEPTVFTTIDSNTGSWQIPVAEENIPKTASICHSGEYELLWLPFGLSNPPATLERAIDIILTRVKRRKCPVYLGDVIVFSNCIDAHAQHVDEVLTLLKKAGVVLQLKKCAFLHRSVEYLGHKMTPGQLGVLKANSRALRDARYRKPKHF